MKMVFTHNTAIIIEWENTVLAELSQPKKMLAALLHQAKTQSLLDNSIFELIFVYNPKSVGTEFVKEAVFSEIKDEEWPGTLHFISSPDSNYYDQKNFAAQNTNAEHLILLDSDVIPDAGWLNQMLTQIRKPEVKVLRGQSYVDQSNFAGKLFALLWFFPLQSSEPELFEHSFFFANNVAFKKDFFIQNSFPTETSYRRQCLELSKKIRAQGETIWCAGQASVSHPAPNGFMHFIKRALAHGHDNVYWMKKKPYGKVRSSPPFTFFRTITAVSNTSKQVVKRGVLGGGSPFLIISAVLAGIFYELVALCASWLTWFAPFALRNRFDL